MKILILLTICGYVVAQHSSDPVSLDLVFVIDKSNTILGRIIKPHVADFLNGLSDQEKTHIRNYALVSFDDKSASNPNSYKDIQLFNNELKNRGSAERDKSLCFAKSLSGLKNGLESSGSGSVIIVVTDVAPNDNDTLPAIKKAIAATHSKVIFVLKDGTCKNQLSKEYQEIALVSNGQIFKVPSQSNNITEVLQGIKSLIGPRRVDLLAVDEEPKSVQNNSFEMPLISQHFSDVLITVSANNTFTLKVTDPNNKELPECRKEFDYLAACRIEKPITGNYTINIENITSTYALRASAISDLTFRYGFQTSRDENSSKPKQVFRLPVKDTENMFTVKFDDPSLIKNLTSIEIIPANGDKNIELFSLTHTRNHTNANNSTYGIYYTFFKPSDSKAHLKIIGTTIENDKEFQLITPMALYPSSDDERENVITDEIHYVEPNELTTQPPETDSSAKLNGSSSLFMTTLAVLFLLVKTAIFD